MVTYQPKEGDKVRVLVKSSIFGKKIDRSIPYTITEFDTWHADQNVMLAFMHHKEPGDGFGVKVGQFELWDSAQHAIESKRAELARLTQEIAELEAQEVEANRPKSPADELAELEAELRRTHEVRYEVRNRVVVALVHKYWATTERVGIAICTPNDEFDLATGKLIALSRALGREVDTSKYGRLKAYEPEVGAKVVIIDKTATNIGAPYDWTNGDTLFITDIFDNGDGFPFQVDGIWCSAKAFRVIEQADKRGAAA